jgi:hypothetical protein
VQIPKGKSPMKAPNSTINFAADDKYDIQGDFYSNLQQGIMNDLVILFF